MLIVNNLIMKNQIVKNNCEMVLSNTILELSKSFQLDIPEVLFSTLSFNSIFLKNKICYLGKSDDGFVNINNFQIDEYCNFYLNVANSGVGTIFTGGFKLPIEGQIAKAIFNNLEQNNESIKNLITNVHSRGTKIFYTLSSAYGRADNKNISLGLFNYSSSYNKCYNNINYYTKKISDVKCDKIVNILANQAKIALDLGFDGVMINGDLYGIIGELTSPETNRRKFGYYNELDDFPKNIINKILEYNKTTKIFYKFTLSSLLSEIYGVEKQKIKSIKNFQSSFSFEKVIHFLIKLVKFGIDGFIIKFGTYESEFLSTSTAFQKDNLFESILVRLIDYFQENNIKNKFGNEIFFVYDDVLYKASKNIAEKDNVLVDFSRQILADYLILKKIREGTNFTNCIKCGYCDSDISKNSPTSCILCPNINMKKLTINSFESSKDNNLNSTQNNDKFSELNEKIAIIGAGTAGIHSALYLLNQGYQIDLYEKKDKINLSSRQCEIFGYNYLLKKYNDEIENMLHKFISKGKLKIFLNTEFNKNFLNKTNYSKIIIATGYLTRFSTIPGAVLQNVKNIYEVLGNENYFKNKEKIVIEAKTELSLSLAQFLLLKNKKVTLLLPSLDFIFKIQNSTLTYYLNSLKQLKCNIVILPKICRIESDFVEVLIDTKLNSQDFRSILLNYKANKTYKIQDRAKNIDLDTYIYEPELVSNNKLYIDFVVSKFPGEIFMVGNALYPCNFRECISSAYFVCKNI